MTKTKAAVEVGTISLNDTDRIIQRELASVSATQTTAGKLKTRFQLARSHSWGTLSQLGTDNSTIAAAWGTSKQQLNSPTYGVTPGAALVRWGVTCDVKALSEEARDQLDGTVIVSEYSVTFRHKDGSKIDEAWITRFRAACRKDDEDQITDTLVKEWQAVATSLEDLEALRTAHAARVKLLDKQPAMISAAKAALALVQTAPTPELLAEIQRVLSLVTPDSPAEAETK